MILTAVSVHAGTPQGNSVRGRLSPLSADSLSREKSSGRGLFTVVAAGPWNELTDGVYRSLERSSGELTHLFGSAPSPSIAIELMDEDQFYRESGAPMWTNAMYFEGKIMIPVSEPVDGEQVENILRSIRHEFTHAYVNAAAAGKCPGWIDEGLAQWFEGPVNPLLQEILASHMRSAEPVPMIYLQGGFTKLDSRIVGPAYGQSLFAVNSLIKTFGTDSIGRYLRHLREGISESDAFLQSFALKSGDFEKKVGTALASWAKKYYERTPESRKIQRVSMYQQIN